MLALQRRFLEAIISAHLRSQINSRWQYSPTRRLSWIHRLWSSRSWRCHHSRYQFQLPPNYCNLAVITHRVVLYGGAVELSLQGTYPSFPFSSKSYHHANSNPNQLVHNLCNCEINSINQSINQSTNQPTNQPTNQSINQLYSAKIRKWISSIYSYP